jgi:signal transduction histidine kinase
MKRPPTARPARSPRRQQIDLLLLYLGSLTAVLVLFAVVVRQGFQAQQLADVRSHLRLIGEDFSGLPLPSPGTEKDLQESRKDFATARQQVEWFVAGRPGSVDRLGEVHTLGPLPKNLKGQQEVWQQVPDWIALVRRSDVVPGVWIRVSENLESIQNRLHQLDATLGVAITVALLLSAASALLLARRSVAPLERSLSRLRQFSLDASHELRGPLAALAANAEMGLLDSGAEGDPQLRRFEAIASAAAQMERLVDDLLLLARQDEERIDTPRPVDFSALLAHQVALHRDAIELKRQTLTLDLTPGLQVLGQATLLNRLARNLLDNAMRYTPEGGQVTVQSYRRGSFVVFSVQDSGIGLSEEELPQVFDRFWRARSDRSDGGSGLGLAIVSRICSSHGGDIRVTSQPGEGSRFIVELPTSS